MEKKHILIGGERGIGKSTLIGKLVRAYEKNVYGFLTKSMGRDETGFHSIYMFRPTDTEFVTGKENHIADSNGREKWIHTEVFESLGVEYLKHEHGLIVMDELGFMEKDAEKFQKTVLSCLDGEEHVLAAVKAKFDVEFLNQIRNHPKADFYEITEENRDALYEQLLPIIQTWNLEKVVDTPF